MNKRNSYIAAAALAIAGTAGMASWLVSDADELDARNSTAAIATTTADAGVSETEAVLALAQPDAVLVPAPGAPVEDAAATEIAPAPRSTEAVVPAVRSTRTPIAASARAAREPAPRAAPSSRASAESLNREPANREAANSRTEPVNREPVEPRTEPVEPVEPVEPAEPVVSRVRVVTVPSSAVLGVRLKTNLSSDTAEIEDRVDATVTRDVIANGVVAIPAGTTLLGSVNQVTRGGKFRERARLSVRFHTLVFADGMRETVRVDSIVREGDSPARESATKIGGSAVGGAIIGGLMGGKKGAILGGAAGAGAGTAAVASGDRSVAVLTAGSPLSVRLTGPITIRREQ